MSVRSGGCRPFTSAGETIEALRSNCFESPCQIPQFLIKCNRIAGMVCSAVAVGTHGHYPTRVIRSAIR